MKTHTQMQDTYNINNKISFIGLGKLGLPLATIFAKNNVDVIGIDKNENIINSLNKNLTKWTINLETGTMTLFITIAILLHDK